MDMQSIAVRANTGQYLSRFIFCKEFRLPSNTLFRMTVILNFEYTCAEKLWHRLKNHTEIYQFTHNLILNLNIFIDDFEAFCNLYTSLPNMVFAILNNVWVNVDELSL